MVCWYASTHSSSGPTVGMGENDPTPPTGSMRDSRISRWLASTSSGGTTRSSPTKMSTTAQSMPSALASSS